MSNLKQEEETLSKEKFNREETIELLEIDRELARRRTDDPLAYMEQHDKQLEASAMQKTIRALFWGNRVGKTEWGAMETNKIAQGVHEFISPGDIWSCSPSFDVQSETTQPKILKYLPPHKILNKTWVRKDVLKDLWVDAGDGKKVRITFKSYEQGREKFQGAGKKFIWFDEEPPQDIWEECFVRQEAGIQIWRILTMTPVKGMTWVYDKIYLNTKNPNIFISEADWNDNPFLTGNQKVEMGHGLSTSSLKVRREGKFIRKTGLVCAWFQRSVHVIDMKELPEGDDYLGIDFGFSAPTCALWIRVDRESNYWIYDGFYRRGLTNPEIQDLIRKKEVGLSRVKRIADSAQASDIKQINDSGIKILGVSKQPGTKRENWDEWRARLMEEIGRVQELTAKPKLFISSELIEHDDDGNAYNFFVKEVENLSWDETKTALGIEQKPIWGSGAKHAIDAFTYVLSTIRKPKDTTGVKKKSNESIEVFETMDSVWD